MFEYQDQLKKYIQEKMEKIAPNLTSLVGANVTIFISSHMNFIRSVQS